MIDWSATAAYTALFAAIISPVITALINNHHQRRMKEIEIFHERRLELISAYLEAAGKVSLCPTTGTISEYGKAYGRAAIYFPPKLLDAAEKFEINGYGQVDFRQLARKFSGYGFTPKRKLW